MTPDYAAAQAAATSLLLEQRLVSLNFDVSRLRYQKPIVFDSMRHFCTVTRLTMAELSEGSDCLQDGCTLVQGGGRPVYLVLYSEQAGRRRRNFTLAHEVGHIYLGHGSDEDREEAEANAFAAQLLLPEVLVWEYARSCVGPVFAEELTEVFGASRAAAQVRLGGLARRGKPRWTDQDMRLLEKCRHLLPVVGGQCPRTDAPGAL